jgi:hypothetical protein
MTIKDIIWRKVKLQHKKIAIILIVVLLIVGLFFTVYYWDNSKEMLKRGCVPKAFDSKGVPNYWVCP